MSITPTTRVGLLTTVLPRNYVRQDQIEIKLDKIDARFDKLDLHITKLFEKIEASHKL